MIERSAARGMTEACVGMLLCKSNACVYFQAEIISSKRATTKRFMMFYDVLCNLQSNLVSSQDG